jgi:hypothetical protein
MPGPEEYIKENLDPIVKKELNKPIGFEIDLGKLEAKMSKLSSLSAPQGAVMAGPHQAKAMQIVSGYIKANLEKALVSTTLPDFDIYVVWFCYTLGNWKALVSTTLPDGMYYEVTYDSHKKCAYLDAYKKFHNAKIPDSWNQHG